MDKQLSEIMHYLDEVNSFSLPKYKELPGVPLYMEQVLQFVNDALSSLSAEDAKPLTSFMVNNYVKSKIIDEPAKKKYSRDQIGYLIAITLMKTTVSMADLSTLLKLDSGISTNKETLYRFWSDVEMSILSDAAKKTSSRVDAIYRRYKGEAGKLPAEQAEQNARDALGLIAMRLAIQAQANKLLSDYIIAKISTSMGEPERPQPKKTTSRKKATKKRRNT